MPDKPFIPGMCSTCIYWKFLERFDWHSEGICRCPLPEWMGLLGKVVGYTSSDDGVLCKARENKPKEQTHD